MINHCSLDLGHRLRKFLPYLRAGHPHALKHGRFSYRVYLFALNFPLTKGGEIALYIQVHYRNLLIIRKKSIYPYNESSSL